MEESVQQTDSQTVEPVTEPTESTTEVVQNTGEESTDGVVEQAMQEVKAPQSINRVQELANRAKVAEAELQKLKEMQSYSRPQPTQNYDPYAQAIIMQEQKLARMEESYLFSEAERSFPELDRNSEKYNKDFDDMVYNTYRAEGITPKEAASKVMKLIKLGQSKAEASLTESNAQKATISTGPQRRSNLSNDDSGIKQAQDSFRKSGKVEDLERLLAT